MLNELFALERGLAAAGATVQQRHPDIKDLAKGSVIRVRLAKDGQVAGIELVPDGGRGALWTLRDGQHNGFPGLKLPAPEREILDEHDTIWSQATSVDEKRAELIRIASELRRSGALLSWPKQAFRNRIQQRFEQLLSLRESSITAVVPAVFERFLMAINAPIPFTTTLIDQLMIQLQDSIWIDPIRAALSGTGALAIDAALGDFSRDAGDPRQVEAISMALQASHSAALSPAGEQARCALSGSTKGLLDGNFPQPNLPGLGQTYLFSRNKDIPALDRYGRMGPGSVAIAADVAGRLSGALLALTDSARRGKTWNLIPAETGDKPDLLIVSLSSNISYELADAFSTEDDVPGWPTVEQAAESVVTHFDGLAASALPQDEVRLLILRTIDPANRKAVYDRHTNVQHLHEAAGRWKAAMHNTPSGISFLVASKKVVAVRRPPMLPPISLVALSRMLFASSGRRRVQVSGLPASEALGIFLNDSAAMPRALRVLHLLLKRHEPLLAGLTHASVRGSDSLKSFDKTMDLRRDALRSAAWIGALLFILGRPKEDYMRETAYKLGQLLAAADAVHIGYCAQMRGGDVPPTLLGNAVFSIAGRDPVRALDILQGRWKPYGAWARRTNALKASAAKDEQLVWQIRRGISQARLAGPLCSEIKGELLGVRVDQIFRAELLLGYVAGLERDENSAAANKAENVDGDGGKA
jgi:hypothetical protein